MCPPHPEPSYLPPHRIPLSCPRTLALGALLHSLNLHWSSVLHMVMYLFQCCSLKSSHSFLLPLRPKVRSKVVFLMQVIILIIETTVSMEEDSQKSKNVPH